MARFTRFIATEFLVEHKRLENYIINFPNSFFFEFWFMLFVLYLCIVHISFGFDFRHGFTSFTITLQLYRIKEMEKKHSAEIKPFCTMYNYNFMCKLMMKLPDAVQFKGRVLRFSPSDDRYTFYCLFGRWGCEDLLDFLLILKYFILFIPIAYTL